MAEEIARVGIIGGGAWGTALALVLRRAGREALVWAREAEVAAAINRDHENPVFLPGIALDPGVRATNDLAEAGAADAVFLVVPAQFLRATADKLAPHMAPGTPVVICSKGLERESGALMSEVAAQVLPRARLAVLSGPTFAAEVARDLPAAATLACPEPALGEALGRALGNPRFRPYHAEDLIGAQIGGAVKNVLAIACGITVGRRLGENARAALITRGLAEMVRLGLAKGGTVATMMGLAGFGDLTLTCNSLQSRNTSLGVGLGEGKRLEDVLAGRKSVAEGVTSAEAVCALARRLDVEMPICAAVDRVLNHGAAIDTAIDELLARPVKAEMPDLAAAARPAAG